MDFAVSASDSVIALRFSVNPKWNWADRVIA